MTVNGSVEWQCRPPAAATATGCVPTAKLVSAQPASAAAASRVPLVVMGTPWTPLSIFYGESRMKYTKRRLNGPRGDVLQRRGVRLAQGN
jgi:hypothetical protein